MAKFLFLYAGGQMAETSQAQEAEMQAWGAWLGGLGEAVVDLGSPFGAAATVRTDGTSDGGTSRLGGYSIIDADSLADAGRKTTGCPILGAGGSVEVYEALPM